MKHPKQKRAVAGFLSFLLCVLLLCPAFASQAAAADAPFVPVLRFIASSDTHIRETSDVTYNRIGQMLDAAYAMAGSDETYPQLDAVLVVGDLTNDGTPAEFEKFGAAFDASLQDETALLAVVAKNHDGYEMRRSEVREACTALTGNDADFHVVIHGFHFIGLSASANQALHYDLGQLSWLKQQLDAAVKENPDRPVFVMHHEPTVETVYGSSLFDGWGVPYFGALLRQYPQVVELSGHSHYPVNDPRSVWQGAYTAINTGAIAYAEFTVESLRTYHPADSDEVANCWIIDVNAQGDLRLRGLDVNTQACLCDFVMQNPADRANRDFTPARRKRASKAPAFAETASAVATPTDGGFTVTVPAAQSGDGLPVTLYRVAAKNALGVTVAKGWVLPQYYRTDGAEEITLALQNLAKGDYTVLVTAENAYGKQSAPLQTSVSISGNTGFAHLGDLLRALFAAIKDFFVHLFW